MVQRGPLHGVEARVDSYHGRNVAELADVSRHDVAASLQVGIVVQYAVGQARVVAHLGVAAKAAILDDGVGCDAGRLAQWGGFRDIE